MVWNSLISQTYHILCTSLNDLIELYNYNTNSDKTELGRGPNIYFILLNGPRNTTTHCFDLILGFASVNFILIIGSDYCLRQ